MDGITGSCKLVLATLVFGTIFETVLVYEVIRYSTITGRSFFVARKDILPKGILAMVLDGCNGCMAFFGLISWLELLLSLNLQALWIITFGVI